MDLARAYDPPSSQRQRRDVSRGFFDFLRHPPAIARQANQFPYNHPTGTDVTCVVFNPSPRPLPAQYASSTRSPTNSIAV